MSRKSFVPKDPRDVVFVLANEGKNLSGVMLPSGQQVPEGFQGMDWTAQEGTLMLKYYDPNLRNRQKAKESQNE